MRTTDRTFSFGADIVKAEKAQDGSWLFEGMASLPGRDLQGEEVLPDGLEIDYLLGKGLPPGAGGYINYDHQPETIVGVPLEGSISPRGFWLKWRALNTPLMRKIVEQMKAMKEAGWPRRYGMSVEGVVKEHDPTDPTRIKRAFIRNVALTPTPVHPGTFVDFAKSLASGASIEYRPFDERNRALTSWAGMLADIRTRQVSARHNRYFAPDGRLRTDQDVPYFRDVHGLPDAQAVRCARYALSREPMLCKAIDERLHHLGRPKGHPLTVLRRHLAAWKREHPECPHIADNGRIPGGPKQAAQHFRACERRGGPEVQALLYLLQHAKEATT